MASSMKERDTYYHETVVAAVDILGLNALLRKGDQSMAAMNALAILRKNAAESRFFNSPSFDSPAGTLYQSDEYFGDSLYLFSNPGLDIGTQVEGLAMKCASLIAVGFLSSPNGFLVRAGIASGDLRRRVVLTSRGEQEIYIGTAMAKGHLLQESQDWVGGAVEAGLTTQPKSGRGSRPPCRHANLSFSFPSIAWERHFVPSPCLGNGCKAEL